MDFAESELLGTAFNMMFVDYFLLSICDCCAHILNLIVKAGLYAIDSGVEAIRDSVAFWTATPKRIENFGEAARQLKVSCTKKLALESVTRWNSTYLMLSTSFLYKSLLELNNVSLHVKFFLLTVIGCVSS